MKSAVVLLLLCSGALGAIVERFLDYTIGDGELYEGYIAYDDALGNDLPGVYLAHQFFGVDDPELYYARFWAEQGYFAFAGDVYTKAIRPTTFEEALGNSSALSNNAPLLRARANGALTTLLNQPQVSIEKGAVIAGYCFGSDTSYELARANPLGLRAAIGFHGTGAGLTGLLGQPNVIPSSTWIQYHHGAEDTATSDNDLLVFQSQLKQMGVENWSTHVYSDAEHGYTNPFGAVYNERAAVAAHQNMLEMLVDLFPGTYRMRDFTLPQPADWKEREVLISDVHRLPAK